MTRPLDNPIWDNGYDAYFDGLGREDNPYPVDSQEAEDWEAGFDTADSDSDDE